MLGDDQYTLEDVIDALRLAGVHAGFCPEGIRQHNQKSTGAYLSPAKCNCWVALDTHSDIVLD
jgi:hypothetical protein